MTTELKSTLSILVWLCVFDTALTIIVITLGWATEANPLMNFFLKHGVGHFILAKLAITFISILLLLKAGAIRTATVLTVMYVILVIYELAMIYQFI